MVVVDIEPWQEFGSFLPQSGLHGCINVFMKVLRFIGNDEVAFHQGLPRILSARDHSRTAAGLCASDVVRRCSVPIILCKFSPSSTQWS